MLFRGAIQQEQVGKKPNNWTSMNYLSVQARSFDLRPGSKRRWMCLFMVTKLQSHTYLFLFFFFFLLTAHFYFSFGHRSFKRPDSQSAWSRSRANTERCQCWLLTWRKAASETNTDTVTCVCAVLSDAATFASFLLWPGGKKKKKNLFEGKYKQPRCPSHPTPVLPFQCSHAEEEEMSTFKSCSHNFVHLLPTASCFFLQQMNVHSLVFRMVAPNGTNLKSSN